jgi:hypothetical protein
MIKEVGSHITISFKGHFYCLTDQGVMVVETSANQPPHLVLAAELPKRSPLLLSTMYLVDNGGELILVNCTKSSTRTKCRNSSIITKKYFIKYKAYWVDLKAMNTKHVLGLGGCAIFIGSRGAISVSTSAFPSIKCDSIYIGLDGMLGIHVDSTQLYCLVDGTSDHCGIIRQDDFDEDCSIEMTPRFGPCAIDDYLSWYVTDYIVNLEDA